MDIKHRIYPYPVLSNFSDDYIGCTFNSSTQVNIEGYSVKFTIESKTDNEELNQLIEAGELAFCYHVECSQTRFRKVFETNSTLLEFEIQDSKINGLVQICPFIIATQGIDAFSNLMFSDDYQGFKFDIEKGCKIGIGKQVDVQVEKSREDLVNTPSIFAIIKNQDGEILQIDMNKDRILILLPEEEYYHYKSIKTNPNIQPVLHSMIIVSPLMYVIERLKEMNGEFFEIENYRWFRALKKILGRFNIEIENGGLDNKTSLELAQLLLDKPLSRAFNGLINNYGEEESI